MAALVLSVLSHGSSRAELIAGRPTVPRRDASVRVLAGAIIRIEGTVRETSRLFYTVTGREASQLTREDYDLEDFGMDSGYGTFGLSTETAWTFLAFESDLLYLGLDTSSTAARNYYIGVNSVAFGGADYEYMQIPAGRSFDVRIQGIMADLRCLITPCTLRISEAFQATPWVSLGLFLVGGAYEIDAGTATGLVQYQNPPETFVVGGYGDGALGGGLPEIGIGGEMRLGSEDAAHLLLRANYAVCSYNGSTDWLTVSSHRRKDIDLDHTNLRLSASLEFPFESGRALSIGARFQLIDTEASITSQGGTVEEIVARRERFDKEVDFRMSIAAATLGVRF